MIAKVTRGGEGAGLVRYLMGKGDENEHAGQRVIAASEGVEIPFGVELSRGQVADLGYQIDAPFHVSGTEVPGGHVWHLSLSNGAGDRVLSDREWGEIVRETMDGLGFTAAAGKAPCPWVAVRHGRSTAGNEHVHVAVSLVREDGIKASIWQDRIKLSRACSTFEKRYGLTVVDGRSNGGQVGLTRPELERAKTAGRQPESTVLAFRVREAAAQSGSEAEFVKRLRSGGVLVRPRYAQGSREVVEGYSVALRPSGAERPVWRGGGRLGKDLSLPKLRERWEAAPVLDPGPVWAQAAAQAETELPRQPVTRAVDQRRRLAGAAQGASMTARRLKSTKRGVVEGLTGDEEGSQRRRRERGLMRDQDRDFDR